jgi:hypothetical protein
MMHVNDQPMIDLPTASSGAKRTQALALNEEWAIESFTTDQWLTEKRAPRRFPLDAGAVNGAWSLS